MLTLSQSFFAWSGSQFIRNQLASRTASEVIELLHVCRIFVKNKRIAVFASFASS